jgi:hypothetical protein
VILKHALNRFLQGGFKVVHGFKIIQNFLLADAESFESKSLPLDVLEFNRNFQASLMEVGGSLVVFTVFEH